MHHARWLHVLSLLAVASAAAGCGSSSNAGNGGGGGTGGISVGGSGGEGGGSGGEGGGTGGSGGSAGSGGTGGDAGSGGTGGMTGLPTIKSFSPTQGGVGSTVHIKGTNFGTDKMKVLVNFTSAAEINPDAITNGIDITTTVPSGASTGPITVTVNGQSVTSDQMFSVTHENPIPHIDEIVPDHATAGSPDTNLPIAGSNFLSSSHVRVNGEEVTSLATPSTQIVIKLTAAMLAQPRNLDIIVTNDPPGGGDSNHATFRVLAPLKMLHAVALGARKIQVDFDAPIDPVVGGNPLYWTITSPTAALTPLTATIDPTNGARVYITTTADQLPNNDYTVNASNHLQSMDGADLDDVARRATFWAYGSNPVEVAVYGGLTGCGVGDMTGPFGISSAGTRMYVAEQGGEQIQVVGSDGSLLGFYGKLSIGNAEGAFQSSPNAQALACPNTGSSDAGAFHGPRGSVAVNPVDGMLAVADTVNDRILTFAPFEPAPASGAYQGTLGTGLFRPVVLGLIDGDVAVADATKDQVRIFGFDGTERTNTIGGTGTMDGQLSFDLLSDTSLPGLAEPAGGGVVFVSEPDNHRLQRFTQQPDKTWLGDGWVGVNHTSGFATGSDCCSAGTANSEFTHPRGVAVDLGGQLYVIDEAGSAPGKGRLQKFGIDGKFQRAVQLDFMPGGLAIDPGGLLWIVDITKTKLHKYKP